MTAKALLNHFIKHIISVAFEQKGLLKVVDMQNQFSQMTSCSLLRRALNDHTFTRPTKTTKIKVRRSNVA